MEVKTRGIGRLIYIFSNLSPKLLSILPDVLTDVAQEVLLEAIRRAPIYRGELAESLTMEVDRDALVAKIGPTAPHGPFVTFGTKPHIINSRVMVLPGIFRFISLHPGTRANPYLEESLMTVSPDIPKIMQPYVIGKMVELDQESKPLGMQED